MVSGAGVRRIVGIIGNVISFGLFLSPAPTFCKIVKKKSVEEFQPYPYLATVMNCMLWVFYGLPVVHPDSILVTTINAIGLVIELIYLAIFFIFCGQKKNARRNILLWLLCQILGEVVVILVTVFGLHGTFAKQTFVGVICDVFNILMYASPILVVSKVVKTRSVEYMPFWLSLLGFMNGLIWTAFSVIHKLDLYVLISNGIGSLFGAIQLIIYLFYYLLAQKNQQNGAVKPSEVQLSSSNVV